MEILLDIGFDKTICCSAPLYANVCFCFSFYKAKAIQKKIN